MINKAILVGRLGRDPECRSTQSGKTVCNFTLATDTGFGETRNTDWHRIVCFDRQADFCRNYMRKGSLVYVEGRISYRQYEKDGVKQYITEIIANTVQSLQTRGESQGAAGNFDVNVYDSPSYGGGSSYNGGSNYNGGGSNYNGGGSNYGSNPAQSAPSNDSFGGDGGINNDEIPF